MEKPLSSWVRLGLLLTLAIFMGGCADLQARIRFTSLSAGVVEAVYTLPWEVLDQGRLTPGKPGILPDSRAAWDRILAVVPGLSMNNFSFQESSRGRTITLTLGFSNPRMLEALVTALGHKLTLLESGGLYTLNFQMTPWDLQALAPDVLTLIKNRWSTNTLQFTLSTPRIIRSASEGDISADRTSVTLRKTLMSLGEGAKAPGEWRIQW